MNKHVRQAGDLLESTYVISSFNQICAQVASYKACTSGYQDSVLFYAWFGFDWSSRVCTVCKRRASLCSLRNVR